jgi:hypothetical protein
MKPAVSGTRLLWWLLATAVAVPPRGAVAQQDLVIFEPPAAEVVQKGKREWTWPACQQQPGQCTCLCGAAQAYLGLFCPAAAPLLL